MEVALAQLFGHKEVQDHLIESYMQQVRVLLAGLAHTVISPARLDLCTFQLVISCGAQVTCQALRTDACHRASLAQQIRLFARFGMPCLGWASTLLRIAAEQVQY